MRIYIIEDDTSVISVLEDIVEGNSLGTICGDSGGGAADLHQIMALAPDLILVDLLMPQKDGIQIVRELKEMGCRAKYIMISQVSKKELVAKAYLAGQGARVYVLCGDEVKDLFPSDKILDLGKTETEMAANLYELLHEGEKIADVILAVEPKKKDGVMAGVINRLSKACAEER